MKRALQCIFAFSLSLGSSFASAQGIFTALEGAWHGSGEVRGFPSEQTMSWEPVFGGTFFKLEFNNVMTLPDGGEFRFSAHAMYHEQDDGTVTGHWFDSRGVSFPLQGESTVHQLNIRWGTPDTELGRTQYLLVDGQLEVIDEVLGEQDQWRQFGQTTLSRK